MTNWVQEILVTFENQSSIIYWFLLRYTVIIYKFTQGNFGVKKIARSRFQSPVKKENRKLRHWRPTARSLIFIYIYISYKANSYAMNNGFIKWVISLEGGNLVPAVFYPLCLQYYQWSWVFFSKRMLINFKGQPIIFLYDFKFYLNNRHHVLHLNFP